MLRQVIDTFEVLDSPRASGASVRALLVEAGAEEVEVTTVEGEGGRTDFVRLRIAGSDGKSVGGRAATVGIIGRLGGVGARPEMTGFVSDGDGAWVAIAAGLKLTGMRREGDLLRGDVIVATHVCPNAPTREHFPVPFMTPPVSSAVCDQQQVDPAMDVLLSIDTSKGNKTVNHRGFAISPTVKDGYILKVSDDLVEIMMRTTGQMARVFPLSQQDITPYGNGVDHINSIMQPAVATDKPVVGVAITAETPVPGCGTGASHPFDIEQAARYVVEVAKEVGEGRCRFYDEEEYALLQRLYGSQARFRALGSPSE